MLLDVFAPSRPIERQNPQHLAAAAKPSGPKPNHDGQWWTNAPGNDHQAAEIQDLRYMQLMNCQRSTGPVFDRSVAEQRVPFGAHMPLHHHHHHHPPSPPHGWVASIPLAGLPIHGNPQPGHQAKSKQPPPRQFQSAEERMAWERFQASQAVKPVGGSRSCVDVPALRTHSRRTWNGQLEEKPQRTDNAPMFHSTLLRAMAHS